MTSFPWETRNRKRFWSNFWLYQSISRERTPFWALYFWLWKLWKM